jgi:hypothetical protein
MEAVIYLDQTPTRTPIFFSMPVQVRVEGDGWDSLLVLNNTQNAQSWDMMFEKEPKRWIFDPFNNILDGRVDQYLTVGSSSSEGIFLLQPNPVKRGEQLRITMSAGFALKSFEVFDTRGVSLLRDESMRSDTAVMLPVEALPSGAYSIRVSVLDDHGHATDRVEKFIIE